MHPQTKAKIKTCCLGQSWIDQSTARPHHSPERKGEVLTPSASECDLICRKGLYRSHQVKMSSSGRVATQYDRRPQEKGKFRERHAGRRKPPSRQGERPGTCPSLTALRRTDAVDTLISNVQPPKRRDHTFPWFKLPGLRASAVIAFGSDVVGVS